MSDGLVLSGGGAAGAYQAGVLQALIENGIVPKFISSNSAGTLNGACLSYHKPGESLKDRLNHLLKIWGSINSRKDVFANHNIFTRVFDTLEDRAIWNSDPLKKIIDGVIIGRSPKIPMMINTYDMRFDELNQISSWGDSITFRKCLLASASIPLMVEAVDGFRVDGGVTENTPLKVAMTDGVKHHKLKRIFVILNSPPSRKKQFRPGKLSVIDFFLSLFEGLHNAAMADDIPGWALKHPGVEVHIIAPTERKVGILDFTQDKIQMGIMQGYKDGIRFLNERNIR